MADGRPDPRQPRAKSDVMQAALQVEAYEASPGEPSLLQYADGADPATSVTQGHDAAYDEHEWDDVVQQTFPASDAPPPPGRQDDGRE